VVGIPWPQVWWRVCAREGQRGWVFGVGVWREGRGHVITKTDAAQVEALSAIRQGISDSFNCVQDVLAAHET
jgi:hypothetical protein